MPKYRHIDLLAAEVQRRRARGLTLDDVPELLAAFDSPDEQVRLEALRRACPCHIDWEVYEAVRKPALRLRSDPNQAVRAAANHLEEDAERLRAIEAKLFREAERASEPRYKPSSKRDKRRGR